MGTCDTPIKYKEIEVKKSNTPLLELEPKTIFISNSICKILYKDTKGTGFFIKINTFSGELNCLMTNGQTIKKELFENKETIDVAYDWEQKKIQVKLDRDQRYIKNFLDEGIDITIIQILPFDNIETMYFLTPDTNNISSFYNKQIYIPQYSLKRNFYYSKGQINQIDNNIFVHDASTIAGSYGSPIFLENSNKVIGILKSDNLTKTENYGEFIYLVIQYLQNSQDYNEINDNIKKNLAQNKKYIEYFYPNGYYYIGPLIDGLPNNRGKIYDEKGNLIYEGEMINGRKEGYGKRYYDNGYYIGQFSNDLKSGKGKYFFNNGEIYEGEFDNDLLEGYGKYIYKNGNYYVGSFSKNLKHGKGKQFYKDGNLQSDIDFNNDKLEGLGRYNFENGEYYIGHCLNGLKHGKGIIHYKNGDIKYEGDFFEDKYQGHGRFNYENGEYYIGQCSNNLKNGKGTIYYQNGDIKCEGVFVNGQYIGKGIYNYGNGENYIGQFSNGLNQDKGIML